MKKRAYYSDEEAAMIVGGYRLTDGYQMEYAAKMGITPTMLSYLVKRARKDDVRAQFPEFFGDAPAVPQTEPVVLGDPVELNLQLDNMACTLADKEREIEELYAKLLTSERRLQNAINLILDK